MLPGQRKSTPRKPQQARVALAFTTDAAERTWRGELPKYDWATTSTVEALMHELKVGGVERLKNQITRTRLGDCSSKQVAEIIKRLTELQASHPATITEALLITVKAQLSC